MRTSSTDDLAFRHQLKPLCEFVVRTANNVFRSGSTASAPRGAGTVDCMPPELVFRNYVVGLKL